MALYGATIGKLGILTFEAATNQACANVIPDTRLVDTVYLFYYLLSQRRAFIKQGQGGGPAEYQPRNRPVPSCAHRGLPPKFVPPRMLGSVNWEHPRRSDGFQGLVLMVA